MAAQIPTTLSRADAVRFLQRATFGGRPSDVEALITMGVENWFEDQLAMTTDLPGFLAIVQDGAGQAESMDGAVWETYLLANDQLRKRVGYALSQILVVSNHELFQTSVAAYADILDRYAFGNYRDLLYQVSRTAAMGKYLTFLGSRKADPTTGRVPDENYAREIMQLFTIGLWQLNQDGTRVLVDGEPVPTYGDADIGGLARVFTGWRERPNLDPSVPDLIPTQFHEPGEKSFLGTTIEGVPGATDVDEIKLIAQNSLDVAIKALTDHPNVGPFIGKQLIQRLVTSNPSPAYVGRISAVWADDGDGQRGNVASVVHAILTDDEAWQASPPDSFGKLREPALRFTTILRALDVSALGNPWKLEDLSNPATALGQQPFNAPSVFNFYRPGYVPPNSDLAGEDPGDSLVGPEFQIADESSSIGWLNFVNDVLRQPGPSGIAIDLDALEALIDEPAGPGDIDALIDEVVARLCPDGISAAVRDVISRRIANIDTNDSERHRVIATVLFVAASTDFLHER